MLEDKIRKSTSSDRINQGSVNDLYGDASTRMDNYNSLSSDGDDDLFDSDDEKLDIFQETPRQRRLIHKDNIIYEVPQEHISESAIRAKRGKPQKLDKITGHPLWTQLIIFINT